MTIITSYFCIIPLHKFFPIISMPINSDRDNFLSLTNMPNDRLKTTIPYRYDSFPIVNDLIITIGNP